MVIGILTARSAISSPHSSTAKNCFMRQWHAQVSPVCHWHRFTGSQERPANVIPGIKAPPPPRTPPRSRRWPPSSRGHHWPRRPRAPHAYHGPPRPSPTHHALWGCPGWPGYARVGRWWPAAASPCRRGSRRWWRRWWPRTPPPTTTRTPTRATTRPSPCVPRLPRGAP